MELAELLARSQKGDKEAFARLAEHYQPYVWRVAWRLMGNREDAEDLAQEIWMKVFLQLPGFKGEAAFTTWLYRVAANTCKDALRRRSRQQETAWEEEIAVTVREDIEGELEIQQLLNQLPPEQRLILIYRDVQGFSYEEITAILRINPGTVKSRLARARQNLRQLWLSARERGREL
ncbi:MAG: RNA polymerase sigma factor [Bacillota bacterium]